MVEAGLKEEKNIVSDETPEFIKEEAKTIMESYLKYVLKDVKVEGSVKDIDKLMEELSAKYDSAMSNGSDAELEQLLAPLKDKIEYAKKAQVRYNKPFEEKLANKSAEESARLFDEVATALEEIEAKETASAQKKVETAQALYTNPRYAPEHAKSAKESARVFNGTINEQNEAKEMVVLNRALELGKTPAELAEYASKHGFKKVDKNVNIGDEQVQIIYEGLEFDITSDGKLLKKIFEKSGIKHEDVTQELADSFKAKLERHAQEAERYRQSQYQSQRREERVYA